MASQSAAPQFSRLAIVVSSPRLKAAARRLRTTPEDFAIDVLTASVESMEQERRRARRRPRK